MFPYCKKCSIKKHPGVPAIEAHQIFAGYPNKQDVLSNVSFKIEQATRVALLGPNGAGKSSLLKALVGLIPISQGDIKILGHPSSAGKHEVTYLPQRSEIDWYFPMTVYKLVLTGSYIYLGWFKKPTQDHKDNAYHALKLLGLDHLSGRQINQLSIGEQQRALIARSLLHNGDVFLLDEPLSGVDNQTQAIIKQVFDQLKSEGKTLLISTHDGEQLEDDFDTALFLNPAHPIQMCSKFFKQ